MRKLSYKSREEYEAALAKQRKKMYGGTTKVRSHPRKGTKGVKAHTRAVSGTPSVPSETVFTLQERKRIASTIIRQIGADTLAFVGAKGYLTGEEDGKPYVQFGVKGPRIMRGGKIRVLYDYGRDLYDVELWRIHMGAKEPVKKLDEIKGVQASQLSDMIENLTG